MTRSFGALGATVLALTLILAACGGSASPTGTAGPAGSDTPASTTAAETQAAEAPPTRGTELNACELVTAADIAAATGIDDVADGAFEENPTSLSPGHSECTYEGDFGRIIVDLTPEDGANLYDAARGAYDDASDITGIGDGAFNSAGENRAFIWQGPVAVMLTMFLNGDIEQLDVATSLGEAVIAKL